MRNNNRSNQFLSRIIRYCTDYRLIDPGDKILLGVSGGPDSVCLLHLFYKLKEHLNIIIAVAHLEHGIRGEESISDQKFVKELCSKLNIDFYTNSVDVKRLRSGGESIEDVARRARYDFFYTIAENHGFNKIALGHNLDDQVETVIYRMIRGTGPEGLVGMRPLKHWKTKYIIRPLLGTSRKEIIDYLNNEGLKYRVDSTNYDIRYSRNRIRHRVLPEIESIDPKYREHISNLVNLIYEDNRFIDRIVQDSMKEIGIEYLKNSIKLDYRKFYQLDSVIKKRLIVKTVQKLQEKDDVGLLYIPYNVLRLISEKFFDKNAVLYSSKEVTIRKEYESLIIQKSIVEKDIKEYLYIANDLSKPVAIPEIGKKLFFNVVDGLEKIQYFENDKIYFDLKKVKLPVIIRNKRPGDRIKLLNVGVKKIKDLFIDDKVSPLIRHYVPLIVINNEIAGVFCSFYGKTNRVSENFKVDEDTEKILICDLKPI